MTWKADYVSRHWRCSECGKETTEKRKRRSKRDQDGQPWNNNQATCSEKCAHERKLRKQRERRQARGQTPRNPPRGW